MRFWVLSHDSNKMSKRKDQLFQKWTEHECQNHSSNYAHQLSYYKRITITNVYLWTINQAFWNIYNNRVTEREQIFGWTNEFWSMTMWPSTQHFQQSEFWNINGNCLILAFVVFTFPELITFLKGSYFK